MLYTNFALQHLEGWLDLCYENITALTSFELTFMARGLIRNELEALHSYYSVYYTYRCTNKFEGIQVSTLGWYCLFRAISSTRLASLKVINPL